MRFSRDNRLNLLLDVFPLDITNLKILDYGGNHGNLLKDGLNPENYTCLDSLSQVIEEAKEEHPEATWVHYDRENPVYNPTGQKFLPFPFEDNSFDIVFAYSVHTHCSYEDFVFDLNEMKRVGKRVATSILDKAVFDFLKLKRLMDYPDVHELWEDPDSTETYRYYVDGNVVVYNKDDIPNRCDYLVSYYNKEWLKEQHPELTLTDSFSPYHQPFLVWTE